MNYLVDGTGKTGTLQKNKDDEYLRNAKNYFK